MVELKESLFDMAGWVKIDNHTGTTFEDASVKVIAGEVNRVNDHDLDYRDVVLYSQVEMKHSDDFVEQSFADYHMYTLQRTTTLKNNQSKQISFLQSESAPYKRYYEYAGDYSDSLSIVVEIENKTSSSLGIPLPAGKVKVYQKDRADGGLEFIGEDRIPHTPKNEPIKLTLGEAFDIKCEKILVDQYEDELGLEVKEYNFIIRNHKAEKSLVKLNHYISNRYWTMVEATETYVKKGHNNLEFWVELEPEETRILSLIYRTDDSYPIKIK